MTDFLKLPIGTKVWHVRYGVAIIDDKNNAYPRLLKIIYLEEGFDFYTIGGKYHERDKFPSLYTLEDARKMGFPVPDEKVKISCRVKILKTFESVAINIPHEIKFSGVCGNLDVIEGKTGTLTFEED